MKDTLMYVNDATFKFIRDYSINIDSIENQYLKEMHFNKDIKIVGEYIGSSTDVEA